MAKATKSTVHANEKIALVLDKAVFILKDGSVGVRTGRNF